MSSQSNKTSETKTVAGLKRVNRHCHVKINAKCVTYFLFYSAVKDVMHSSLYTALPFFIRPSDPSSQSYTENLRMEDQINFTLGLHNYVLQWHRYYLLDISRLQGRRSSLTYLRMSGTKSSIALLMHAYCHCLLACKTLAFHCVRPYL